MTQFNLSNEQTAILTLVLTHHRVSLAGKMPHTAHVIQEILLLIGQATAEAIASQATGYDEAAKQLASHDLFTKVQS
jgi:hypothetical protein